MYIDSYTYIFVKRKARRVNKNEYKCLQWKWEEKGVAGRDRIENPHSNLCYTVLILIIYVCFTCSKNCIKGNIDKHTEKENDNRVCCQSLDT